MKQRKMSVICAVLVVLALVFVAGCGPKSPPVVAKPRATIYYPEAPDPPRLQFLHAFTDLDANPRESGSSFTDFIVGAKISRGADIKSPYGIAARDGKLYICDLGVANIYILDIAKNKFSLMGKPGVFGKPVNITITPDGTKYVSDTGLGKVVVFDAQDRFVRLIGDPTTCTPIDVAPCQGELIVADIKDNEVEAWSTDGKFRRKIASSGKRVDQLYMPTNLAVGPKGRIFVSETTKGVIKVYNIKGQYLGDVGAPGDRPGFFARPKGIAIDPNGILYVADAQWEIIQLFDPEGRILMAFGGAKPGLDGMGMPSGIAIDRTSLPAFEKYMDKNFQAEYLLFVSNQFGPNKIGVYAFGKSKTADYSMKPTTRPSTQPSTQPSTRPAATQPAGPLGAR